MGKTAPINSLTSNGAAPGYEIAISKIRPDQQVGMTTTTITPQKTMRTLKSFFPIIEWLPKYKGSWLRFDLDVERFLASLRFKERGKLDQLEIEIGSFD